MGYFTMLSVQHWKVGFGRKRLWLTQGTIQTLPGGTVSMKNLSQHSQRSMQHSNRAVPKYESKASLLDQTILYKSQQFTAFFNSEISMMTINFTIQNILFDNVTVTKLVK